MTSKARLFLVSVALTCASLFSAPTQSLPWGDQGDGSFRNPILFADYSDPDVIRVGDDFYLVASDFHFMGIQILHSRDLVNWTIVGQLFDRLEFSPIYSNMTGYSQGTWAPTLRYHKGEFLVYVCTPHDGLLRFSARKPEGPWSLTVVKEVDRWEDPCPFWDEDGQAYLVHSVLGAGPLILHKMNAEGTKLLDDGVTIYKGPVAEGPKLFKREGWYYISLPEGGVSGGGQTMLRSRNITGPYERREVLVHGSPHQGGIVDLGPTESWFIGFKSTGFYGRVCHLIPVRWGEDGWPVFGNNGETIAAAPKPALPRQKLQHPQRSDDFKTETLGLQWQWNHNPVPANWSLTSRPGWLRLRGLPAESATLARNSLTQKLWGPAGRVTVKLDASELSDAQVAGLAIVSGKVFNCIGVRREGGKLRVFADASTGPEARSEIFLRAIYGAEKAHLEYSFDGKTFQPLGEPFTPVFGQWKGARIALLSYGPGDGSADFDEVSYEVTKE